MRLVLLILAFYTSGCSHESFKTGVVIDTVTCKADVTQSYALYIPANSSGAVVYCFDAHGAGALPLNKYKSLADKYGYILVGSNNSKNGNDWSVTENIWNVLFGDTRQRLKIDTSRIYTCGFSGGAKVAGYVALKYPVIKSVIANGAGLPDGAVPLSFTYTAIAGEGDLNLTDIVALNDAITTKHHLILFDGKHEWAPVATMDIAFAGLQLDAGVIPKDYISGSKARLDAYTKANLLLKAAEECRLSISYLADASFFSSALSSLINNPLYQKQFQEQKEILIKEQGIKADYYNHYDVADAAYWPKIINGLSLAANGVSAASNKNDKSKPAGNTINQAAEKAKNKSEGNTINLPTENAINQPAEKAMNQRLLAYLSLMFYSISNHFILDNNNEAARHFVDLYKLADPTNNEAWYFSAILYARENNAAATEKELLKAIEYGFKDKARLQQQNEIQKLAAGMNMELIERKM
jgi:hypothetical protein